MSNKVRAAIIGCGNIAGAHGPAYKAIADHVELAYCIDLIPERAEEKKAAFGDENTVCLTDYREMLKDPTVDVVSVCLPNDLHAPVTIDCLNAGKHVLCEKPVALNYEQALTMKEAADRNGRILNIGVVNRFNRAVEAVRESILSGELGEVYQIYCSFRAFRSIPNLGGWFTTKARSGGGALIDWGVHFLDLINYCMDNPQPKTVSAVCHAKLATDLHSYHYRWMHAGPTNFDGIDDVEEYVTGLVRTDGPTLTFNGAWAQNIDEDAMFIEFMGTKGGIKLQYGGNFTLYSTKNGMLTTTTFKYPTVNMYHAEIRDFLIKAPQGIKTKANIDQALVTSQVMDMMYKSSELGEEVKA